jgi:hypothetical protein
MFFCSATTSLQSAVVDDVDAQDHQNKFQQQSQTQKVRKGKPIARGYIVSAFRGGLVAVRVDDDLSNDVDFDVDPAIVDTTKSLLEIKKTPSSSNTLGTSLMENVSFWCLNTWDVLTH